MLYLCAMQNKAYFIDTETDELYELSTGNRKRLEKLHPKWTELDCEKNYDELNKVYEYFKKYGKLVGHPYFKNVFVGLTI